MMSNLISGGFATKNSITRNFIEVVEDLFIGFYYISAYQRVLAMG